MLNTSKFPIVTLSIAMICAAILTGCNEEKPAEVVQTVEWYKANTTEMQARLKVCDSNPGQLALTPNCVNAKKASEDLVWANRKLITPPKAPTF